MKRREFLRVTAAGSALLGAPGWMSACSDWPGLGAKAPLDVAEAVGAWLMSVSRMERRSPTWPMVPGEGDAASLNLYSGTPGVILFFLELHHATGNPDYLKTALEGSFLLQGAFLEGPGWTRAAGASLDDPVLVDSGLYTGQLGAAFALSETAHATGGQIDPMGAMIMFDAAMVMAQEAGGGVAWYQEDPGTASYDIISGSAGIGLGILYAHERLDFYELLDTAVQAGRYLIEKGRPVGEGLKWPISESNPRLYPNFSHGTGGVSYFLARLAEVTGEQEFLDASIKGARYLQSVARCEDDGCMVFHHEPGGEELFYLGWCHGPVGTSRLFQQLAQVTGEQEWKDWVLRGATALRNQGIPSIRTEGYWNNVSQCCGDAGVGDFFLSLAAETGDLSHLAFAKELADHILGEASEAEVGLNWNQAEHRTQPEFLQAQTGWMQGAAGVGAFFLHLDGAEKGRAPLIRFPDSPWLG